MDWMATLCGHGLDPLFDAARRAGFRLIDTRNEQTASYVADYAGRLTRRAGVCAVSSGVAAGRLFPPTPRAPAGRDDIDAVASALSASERPLIVAGSGVFYAGISEDLTCFSERFSIPVTTPIWDRGSIERPIFTFMGVI